MVLHDPTWSQLVQNESQGVCGSPMGRNRPQPGRCRPHRRCARQRPGFGGSFPSGDEQSRARNSPKKAKRSHVVQHEFQSGPIWSKTDHRTVSRAPQCAPTRSQLVQNESQHEEQTTTKKMEGFGVAQMHVLCNEAPQDGPVWSMLCLQTVSHGRT